MKESLRSFALAAALTSSISSPAFAEEPPLISQETPSINPVTLQTPEISPTTEAKTKIKPNIVVIMLDDINPIDGRLFTKDLLPTVYATFEEQGIEFTQYYGETPLCCPGRANFLTGQHTQNHGVLDNMGRYPKKFDDSETIATTLQDAGYSTMIVGKYLNGFKNFEDKTPQGWTYQAIPNLYNVGPGYNYELITRSGVEYYGNQPQDFATDVYAQKTAEFITDSDPNKPIFAYISPLSSHAPMTPAPRHLNNEKCEQIDPWIMPFGFIDEDDPDFINQSIRDKEKLGYDLVNVCKSLLSTDDLLKTVLDALEKSGRLENTMLVFTADNGMAWGDHGLIYKDNPYATHLPLFINWEGVTPSEPIKYNDLISNIDLAPTLADAAGVEMGPYSNGQRSADGISFLDVLSYPRNDPNFDNSRNFILESSPKGTKLIPAWWAIRTTAASSLGNYHFISYETGEIQLYDLKTDPNQLNNIAYEHQNKKLVRKLKFELKKLKKNFKPEA